jgi:hypothetical protein
MLLPYHRYCFLIMLTCLLNNMKHLLVTIYIHYQQYSRLQMIGVFPTGACIMSTADNMAEATWRFDLYTVLASSI